MRDSYVKGIAIRDVVVEFFGSLVPGLLFLIICLFLVIGPTAALVAVSTSSAAFPLPEELRSLAQASLERAEANRWLIIALLTLAGYVVGQFFHRQDIKVPDKRSFRRILPDLSPDEWVASTEDECEFPYLNLRQYLRARGLDHLEAMIPWSGQEQRESFRRPSWSTATRDLRERICAKAGRMIRAHPLVVLFLPQPLAKKLWRIALRRKPTPSREGRDAGGIQRTKVFINTLKLRIFIYHPDKYTTIARNEAHVRLNASSWYMASLLMRVSLLVLFFIVTIAGWMFTVSRYLYDPIVWAVPVAIPAFVFLTAWWSRITIERVLHYQRVREITFALESAYVLFREQPSLLRDVCPDYLPNA